MSSGDLIDLGDSVSEKQEIMETSDFVYVLFSVMVILLVLLRTLMRNLKRSMLRRKRKIAKQ